VRWTSKRASANTVRPTKQSTRRVPVPPPHIQRTAIYLLHALEAEADAEDGDAPRKGADRVARDARVARRARPGRDDDTPRRECDKLLDRQRIMTDDRHARAELLELLDDVVREGVLVVNHERLDGRRAVADDGGGRNRIHLHQ
jgi:hypothetical protein